MEITEDKFDGMTIKDKLSVLYRNTEETKISVQCLAKQKEKLIPTIIKWGGNWEGFSDTPHFERKIYTW